MRWIEFIFGLDRGFLDSGQWSLGFNPHWPGQEALDRLFNQPGWGATLWNLALFALIVWLIHFIYRREGRSRPVRVVLGIMRGTLLLLILALLNNPVVTRQQSRTEPSVLAVMIDKSISMRVRDAGSADKPLTRLQAAERLLAGDDAALLQNLSRHHTVRLYDFDRDARPLAVVDEEKSPSPQADDAGAAGIRMAERELAALKPDGSSTRVLGALQTVLSDLQGQRLAGVVVLTDGRETPVPASPEALAAVKAYGVKVYPIAIGSDEAPKNIVVQSVDVQDAAFEGDIVNLKAVVRGDGFATGHPVKLVLTNKATGQPLRQADGSPVEQTVELADDRPQTVELQFKPDHVGPLDIVVQAVVQPGEIDEQDNTRIAQTQVLDAKVNLLYVDGYPRWDYRFLKNEMLREKTVNISCLLTSADPTFAQEGDPPSGDFPGPITRFPETMEEMLKYDVILLGDVDPRQFTDAQLQLIADFVSRKGGGFGMVAGPRWSPQAYRNTPIEAVLPVSITHAQSTDPLAEITHGFRPVLTSDGQSSSIFRFFADRKVNARYIATALPSVFWYDRGIAAKPGVGEVYAEHPTDLGPDGRKAPILVLGRFGAGRTLFSAIDDSWRWRFYTGESIFDTYWIQQIRYLARSKKLGQRGVTFTSLRPDYELGEQVQLMARVLDPQLQQQLPETLRVEVINEQGQLVRQESLMRQPGQLEQYSGSFTADRVGRYTAKLAGVDGFAELPFSVSIPRLELQQPRVDRVLLSRLAGETLGRTIDLSAAPAELEAIPSAARVIPLRSSEPLWNAPLVMALFVLLITSEWIVRKMYGMV